MMRLLFVLLAACGSPIGKVKYQAQVLPAAIDGMVTQESFTLKFTQVNLNFQSFSAERGEARLLLGTPADVSFTDANVQNIAEWQSIAAKADSAADSSEFDYSMTNMGFANWAVAGNLTNKEGARVVDFLLSGADMLTCQRATFKVLEGDRTAVVVTVHPEQLFRGEAAPRTAWLTTSDSNGDGVVTDDEVSEFDRGTLVNNLRSLITTDQLICSCRTDPNQPCQI